MFSDLLIFYPWLFPFLMVLFRLLGLIAFVPFFSNSSIPGNVKILLALAITFCVWNVVPHVTGSAVPNTLAGLGIAVAGEMSVGLLMGLLLGCVFGGVQLGAHLVSQQMGLSMATIYDPSFEDQTTVMEQIAFWLALVAFLGMGGHREMVNAVLYSYKSVPMASGGMDMKDVVATACGAIDASFHAAARIAMPALVAFFVATLTAGLMSRAMPQMNMMTIGVHLNLLVGFSMVMLGLAGWALVAENSFHQMWQVLGRLFG